MSQESTFWEVLTDLLGEIVNSINETNRQLERIARTLENHEKQLRGF